MGRQTMAGWGAASASAAKAAASMCHTLTGAGRESGGPVRGGGLPVLAVAAGLPPLGRQLRPLVRRGGRRHARVAVSVTAAAGPYERPGLTAPPALRDSATRAFNG